MKKVYVQSVYTDEYDTTYEVENDSFPIQSWDEFVEVYLDEYAMQAGPYGYVKAEWKDETLTYYAENESYVIKSNKG